MDAFHYEDVRLFQFHLRSRLLPSSELEAVFRDIDGLSVQEVVELAVEQVKIHRIQGFEVIVSVFV